MVVLFGSLGASAQDCQIHINGQVIDEFTGDPLSFATIYLENRQSAVQADENGLFKLSNLCRETLHLKVSHVSCESETVLISIKSDTSIVIKMHHHEELMNEVVVHGYSGQSKASNTIDADVIKEKSAESLSNLLSYVVGVSALKTGTGISKPIIHGLYANRVAILNNGVIQAGQQWGNDHAPEIDPNVASHIAVIKGASALEYSGESMGGVVLVEPNTNVEDPHLHGRINYHFGSNGLEHVLNTQLTQKVGRWGMGTTLSYKLAGDYSAPDYYLTNTGKKELDGSFFLSKHSPDKWNLEWYISTFNTSIGILKGAQVGSLTDLENAYVRDEPFFTESNFSYFIGTPKQDVNHHLSKWSAIKSFANDLKLSLITSSQLNLRKEYDTRRGGRSGIPVLALSQFNQQLEVKLDQARPNGGFRKTGVFGRFIDNTNNPETGILPLIPDYRQYTTSWYGIQVKNYSDLQLEIGLRADYSLLHVWAISKTLPREIINEKYHQLNTSFSAGLSKAFNQNQTWKNDLGFTRRSPAINELYSFGLHQGVSSIEEGNANLKPENGLKYVMTWESSINKKHFINASMYAQYFQDYIYLAPQKDALLTIRGAFPYFKYDQTNATVNGLDIIWVYSVNSSFKNVLKAAYTYGQDIESNKPLPFIPPFNLSEDFTFFLSDGQKLKNSLLGLNLSYAAKQNRQDLLNDIKEAPEAYVLVNLKVETSLISTKKEWHIRAGIDNLLNYRYRDYLNRQRYFADAPGRNIYLGTTWEF